MDEFLHRRRIRQIWTVNTSWCFLIYALCNDGTLWSRSPFDPGGNTGWDRVDPIPGDVEDEDLKDATPQEKSHDTDERT